MTGQPEIEHSHIKALDRPGLGIDIVEEEIAKHSSQGNISLPDSNFDYRYFMPMQQRPLWLSDEETAQPTYRAGQIF